MKNFLTKEVVGGIVVLIIILVILNQLRKGVTGIGNIFTGQGGDFSQHQKNEVEKSKVQSNDANITVLQATAFANSLYSAMKGLGTNYPAIRAVFENSEVRTDADIHSLISMYGVRDGENLAEWIRNDMPWSVWSPKYMAEWTINPSVFTIQELNSILERKNISYRFTA